MTYTLAQARTRITTDLLDDKNGTRWDDTKVDRALTVALSQCLDAYSSEGGDRFLQDSGSVSTSSGVYDASSLNVLRVVNVSLIVSSTYEVPLPAQLPKDRFISDGSDQDIRLLYVERYALPSTTSHPLVGVGATAANSWDAFDDWVCVTAARQLELLDREQATRRLEEYEAKARASVLDHAPMHVNRRFPRRRPAGSYAWHWLPTSVYLTRR